MTVVPTPRSLCTRMVPPFSWTFRLAMVSPSPVPVALVEKYGSKILAIDAGSIPTPVSVISTITVRLKPDTTYGP